MRTTTRSSRRSRASATTITAGGTPLTGCSFSVQPFPRLATADTASELGGASSAVVDAATAAALDRDDDGRLDLTIPVPYGISFEGDGASRWSSTAPPCVSTGRAEPSPAGRAETPGVTRSR